MASPKTRLEDQHEKLLILDFGSQYTQLIARRVREHRVYSEIHHYDLGLEAIRSFGPTGIVLSGGPDSVYDPKAPALDPGILELGVPVLGICYGMQAMTHVAGGEVKAARAREYGRAEISVRGSSPIFKDLAEDQTVWMSHGDRIEQPPAGFAVCASTSNAPVVAIENVDRALFGIQFHPEVSHTACGAALLRNFLYGVCGFSGDWVMSAVLEDAVRDIKEKVGDRRVITALSGGVDSSVMATLVQRAVGDASTAIFVDNGLLR
ncbi:MAG: glutamine-hydrolyzing GMP synthase, partial [Acidobacteriota bacterium]